MVLEALTNPVQAEQRPWQMFFLGILFTLVAIIFSLWIFQGQASLVMVFLIVMAALPIIYNTIKLEEQKDEEGFSEKHLMKEHAKALSVFMFLFLGITIAIATVYVFIPNSYIDVTFGVQNQAIMDVNSEVSGRVVSPSILPVIFFNNVKVLIFCVLFAFVFGAGAIFILTWNASVIGVALGNFIRVKLAELASASGYTSISHYFSAFSLGVLRYATHGVFEILAYFIAGLAGGLISVSIIRNHFGTKKFEKVLFDSSGLLLLSFGVLFAAGLIEVYVTPLFF